MARGLQVERYTPPVEALRVARNRLAHIIMAWRREGSNFLDLEHLAVSCYFQGIEDTAQALAISGPDPSLQLCDY